MNGLEDRLQPTPSELACATERAREYWRRLANEALPRLEDDIWPFNLQDLLFRVPVIPAKSVQTFEATMSTRKALLTRSSSTFHVEGKCDISLAEKNAVSPLLFGIQRCVTCRLTETGLEPRQAVPNTCFPEKSPGYLGILSLAWAYILSSRLLELQEQDCCGVAYTTSMATLTTPDQETPHSLSVGVDIGEVDKSAARWWAAILAPGKGWQAIVLKRKGGVYFAPWSYSLAHDPTLSIRWRDNGTEIKDPNTPPTSTAALGYLIEFCLLHNLHDEIDAAFAAALTFPTHNHYGTPIEIPWSIAGRANLTAKPRSRAEYIAFAQNLAYYMSLSCNYSVMSSLCGSFWEPTVGCNLVSPWLHPVLEEIPKLPQFAWDSRRYPKLIAIMCAARRPTLSPLWAGASLSGLVGQIIDLVRTGTPPLDPNCYFWTGSAQNFLDLPGATGPTLKRALALVPISR